MAGAKARDVRALVARLSREGAALQERELLAPLLPGGRVRVRLSGLVYEFRLRETFSGWGRFRPLSEREAALVGPALPWQRAAYLELFPVLRVVLLWPDPDSRSGAWWALPFNESDARQRFGLDGAEPLPVYLADPADGAERFERALARFDGQVCCFDSLDLLADPRQAEWLREAASAEEPPERFLAGLSGSQRRALLYAQLRRLDLGEAARYNERAARASGGPRARLAALQDLARQERLQRDLQRALARADATLHSFQEQPPAEGRPAQLVVDWSERGRPYRYRSVLDRGLSVVSSGICLSGRDRDFDLTSLVSVMAGSPWRDEGGQRD